MKPSDIPPDGANRVTLQAEVNYAAGERLDVWVTARLPKISRNRVQKLIGEGAVTFNGSTAKASTVVQAGDVIEVTFPHPPRPPAIAEDIPLKVIYEDDQILVVNKEAGMVVHPAAGHHDGTLVNALLGRYDDLPVPGGPTVRPGIVHRIDKETSGLLVVAKTEHAMTQLGRKFHDHDIEREYVALVWGDPGEDSGTVDAPIGRHPSQRQKFAIVSTGKRAVTHWKVLERFGFLSMIALTLETGRTHQIRVHMASRGWPVVADPVYGGNLRGLGGMRALQRDLARGVLNRIHRQALHARVLGFEHPETREKLHFEVDLPDDFNAVLSYLREQLSSREGR
ncbi:MAG: RluA family pseudouridine synthase [bacterium]